MNLNRLIDNYIAECLFFFKSIMKRDFKQWWSTISTKRNNHLLPQITEHKKVYYIWHWKSRSWLGTASKMGSLYRYWTWLTL